MAIFKMTAAILLLVAAAQVAIAATTSTRSGTSAPAPTNPKKEVETFDVSPPLPPVSPPLTPRPSVAGAGDRKYRDCPGAWDGPTNVTVILLETRADQLESEVKTPRRAVVEALGEDKIRRLQTPFSTAAAGFRALVTDANRLATENNLPCEDRKTILKRYTEKNASFTKQVSDAYAVLAKTVRDEIKKKPDTRLSRSADEYEGLFNTYRQAHDRAERQRAAAAKLK